MTLINFKVYKVIFTWIIKIKCYIAENWNAKQITPKKGLEHWKFIQSIKI